MNFQQSISGNATYTPMKNSVSGTAADQTRPNAQSLVNITMTWPRVTLNQAVMYDHNEASH